ncbi:hypothetical protein PIB30_050352 [Stylosanthes scabra]|uniref:Uncharacterized protein n=1 Tax=Stylosanthes scabra TaxID=79078 RepID=A0ABU6XIG6_9FABA|nr:hypothetical protein [Stylosanthes scabra]
MATTRQGNNNINKVSDHRISDFSLDSVSLSFAGLVSIQDQQQQQPNPTVNNIPNNHNHNQSISYKLPEPDFEFATNKGSSEPKNSGSGVLLISNGQLVPQSSQPNRSPLNQIPQGTLGTYLASDNHQQRPRPRPRPRPRHHQMSSGMPSGQTGNPRKYHYEALGKARKHYGEGDDYDHDDDDDDEKKNKKKKKSFGKKALSSFISPCRDCKAIEPSAVKYSKTQVSKYDE